MIPELFDDFTVIIDATSPKFIDVFNILRLTKLEMVFLAVY